MLVATLEIAQYDCPVVRLTESMEDVKVVVFGANTSMIKEGIEKIYIKISSEDPKALFASVGKIQNYESVISSKVLLRTETEAKLLLFIKKTKAMEASVSLDAMPLAPWIAKNGYEKWVLGFHNKKLFNAYLSMVKESDIVRSVEVREIPEEVVEKMSAAFLPLAGFVEKASSLSPRQARVLEFSVERGYYDWPRKSNTVELSRELGISRVAVTKLLRKAEGNILKEAVRVVRELKKYYK